MRILITFLVAFLFHSYVQAACPNSPPAGYVCTADGQTIQCGVNGVVCSQQGSAYRSSDYDEEFIPPAPAPVQVGTQIEYQYDSQGRIIGQRNTAIMQEPAAAGATQQAMTGATTSQLRENSRCAQAASSAQSTCTLGLSPAQMSMMSMASSNLTQLVNQGGTEGACKAAKTMSGILAAANAAHGAACQAKVSACRSTCTQEKEGAVTAKEISMRTSPYTQPMYSEATRKIRIATDGLGQCAALEANVIAAMMSALQNLGQFATAGKCQREVAGNQPPPPGMTPPAANDCTNPMFASTPTCVCLANPRDPMCSTMNTGLDSGGFSSGAPPTAGGGAISDMEGGITFDDDIPLQEASNGGPPNLGGGSGGGSGPMGGGGGGGLPPEEGGAAGPGPYNTDVMTGLTGGSGGGSGFGGGAGGGREGGGGGLFDSLADKLNLKGFLPSKADFKNRGLAGGGADGITGPNGPSLFEKVTFRYRKEQPKLMP
jgi:hypothetical protein